MINNHDILETVEKNYDKLNNSHIITDNEHDNKAGVDIKIKNGISNMKKEFFNIALSSNSVFVNGVVVGGLTFLSLTPIIDNMLYDVYPSAFAGDKKEITLQGKLIKVMIIVLLYILIEKFVLPSI